MPAIIVNLNQIIRLVLYIDKSISNNIFPDHTLGLVRSYHAGTKYQASTKYIYWYNYIYSQQYEYTHAQNKKREVRSTQRYKRSTSYRVQVL